MLNLGRLVNAVQQNCHISDARHAGDFTLCIFLLKMREFYRWEHDIPLAQDLPKNEVGAWLQEREEMWEHLESSNFEPLQLEHGAFDPFDAEAINRELIPQGYIYSGGYGRFHKPHFFLGHLIKKENRAGHDIYISSCEYARDLEAPPAVLQGKTIFIRQESAQRFLWEKIEERRWAQKNDAMDRALACYAFDKDTVTALECMTHNETETMILHELGEALAGEQLGEDWHQMLGTLSRSKAEIMVRAVRDILADCLSTLPGLLAAENHAAIHFYFANYGGMRKYLFPEAVEAYRRYVDEQNLEPLHTLAENGKIRWRNTANQISQLHKEQGEAASAAIEKLLEFVPTFNFPRAPQALK